MRYWCKKKESKTKAHPWPPLNKHLHVHVCPLNLDHISAWTANWLWQEWRQCQAAWTSHQLCQLPLRWHWTGRTGTWPRVSQPHWGHTGGPPSAFPHPHPWPGRSLLHWPHGHQPVDKGSKLWFIKMVLFLFLSPASYNMLTKTHSQ